MIHWPSFVFGASCMLLTLGLAQLWITRQLDELSAMVKARDLARINEARLAGAAEAYADIAARFGLRAKSGQAPGKTEEQGR